MEKMEKAKQIYGVMKNYFFGSEYLAYVSLLLTDMIELDKIDKIAERSMRIYDLMRKEHPFLTGTEDSIFAALLAFSEKSDEQLVEEMERVYNYFRKKFGSNAVQSVSHVLALTDGDADVKCKRVEFLWDSTVSEFITDTRVTGISIKNVKTETKTDIFCDGVFVSIGRKPATDFLKGNVLLDKNGYIIADESTRTSVDGVFAAGDIRTKALRQVVTAAADGAVAAHYAEEYLAGK